MSIDPVYLLYGVIFLGGLLLVEGAYYFYVDAFGGRRAANRRMRMLVSGADAEKVFIELRREQPAAWSHMGPLGEFLTAFDRLISQAGVTLPATKLLVYMAVLSGFLFVGVTIYAPAMMANPLAPFVLLVLSALMGFGLPTLYLSSLRTKRLNRFEAQLPDTLDMMGRSLRVGHPISVAMELTARQSPDPIGSELGLAVDEMTYGRDLAEAMVRLGDRVPLPDVQFVVMAVTIQNETGGNLADVLSNLAALIRSRFRMHKKVRSLSAEGRFSAKVLAAIPFVVGAVTYSVNPRYYISVSGDPLFIKILIGGFVLQVMGILIMRRMINFRF